MAEINISIKKDFGYLEKNRKYFTIFKQEKLISQFREIGCKDVLKMQLLLHFEKNVIQASSVVD